MHTLPALPYEYSALEPHIDARTMEIHHTKHHQAYIDKLNAALDGALDLQALSVEDLLRKFDSLPEAIKTAVRNHGGGHANHTLFWESMSSEASMPSEELTAAITANFESLEKFKEQFTAAAGGRFGSGWAWLVAEPDKTLAVYSTANQDSPLMQGDTPLLGLDVWEHAYYLNYQNRRPDYVTAFWNLVNWSAVASRHQAVLQ
ncbi:MAG: superoxide dismutase [Candidatus Pacebacteria bacterium CG_4_10_14_0_8_um_filter_42_14]|nr:MAG: superoxide dismutase [Candidatus Pacebacteria bacterium CG_4_10_14_0_8_um_filter_42_14]